VQEHHQPTTVAILGANTVVESALAQLLEGEGYSIRPLKSSSTGSLRSGLTVWSWWYSPVASPAVHVKPSSAPCNPPRREELQTRAYG
jgi:hypothetical protein